LVKSVNKPQEIIAVLIILFWRRRDFVHRYSLWRASKTSLFTGES